MTEDFNLPCAQALLAGTLALMTAYAGPGDGADPPARRSLLARKIVSNLFFLREHPLVDDAMRRVVGKVHAHWVALLDGLPPVEPLPAAGHSLH